MSNDDFTKPENLDWATLAEFEAITNRGHWCAACGEEQPTDTPCAECYTPSEFTAAEPDPIVSRYTPQDRYSLTWLWRQ